MWLQASCEMHFEVEVPTPFIFMLRPRNTGGQWITRESYSIQPSIPLSEFSDAYGNSCQRLVAPPGILTIATSAIVHTPATLDVAPGAPFVDVEHLPNEVLTYLFPSRYCESDRFLEMSHEIVGDVNPGYDQVELIHQWLRKNITFNPHSPYFQMSAIEVNLAGEGVCREIAHLGIALCRSLCIPARMVVGYLYGLEPMDFHAWFEAFVGGRWYAFDPTQPEPLGGRVIVAYGHDASDVAIYSQFGPALYASRMLVNVEQLQEPEHRDAWKD